MRLHPSQSRAIRCKDTASDHWVLMEDQFAFQDESVDMSLEMRFYIKCATT